MLDDIEETIKRFETKTPGKSGSTLTEQKAALGGLAGASPDGPLYVGFASGTDAITDSAFKTIINELQAKALEQAQAINKDQTAIRAIKIAAYTGLEHSEAVGLKLEGLVAQVGN